MGHLYKEALSHIPGVTTGVKLTTLSLSAHKCEQCCLTNSKQILSRRPSLIPLTEPYMRVDFDLIYMKINEPTEWVYMLYYYCPFSYMNYMYVLNDKREAVLILIT